MVAPLGIYRRDLVKEMPLVWQLYVLSVSRSFSSSVSIGLSLR